MAGRRYNGRFAAEQVEAVLAAAAPLPTASVPFSDPRTGKRRDVLIEELIVRRLETLAWELGMAADHAGDLSPSTLRSSCSSLVSALDKALSALGAGPGGDHTAIPPQLFNTLALYAEVRQGRLRLTKRGVRSFVHRDDADAWVAELREEGR